MPISVLPKKLAIKEANKIIEISKNPPKQMIHPWYLQSHLLADWIYSIAVNKKILDSIENIIGPNILIQSVDIFIKRPKSTKYINWHQDANYWGLEPFELVTGWIALTDVYVENGCMNYLPKSHLNKIFHKETFDKNSDLTRGQEIDLQIDNDKKVPIILKSGQMSMHHCLLAHDSGPNLTDSYRIALAVRYLPTYVKQTEGPPISVVLARGVDEYNHFKKDNIPSGNFDQKSINEHHKAMNPHKKSNYATS